MTALPIQLPDGFFPRITQGASVSVGDLLAETTLPQEISINLVEHLRLSPEKTRKMLKKNPGGQVTAGDVLAATSGFFGLSKAEVISNVSGLITRYERHSGRLAIRTGSGDQQQKIVSPVAGIIALCNNKQIVIQTQKHALQGEKGSGATIEGDILFLEALFSDNNHGNLLYYLDAKTIGKIVVGNVFTREMLLKGIGIGIKGIIAATIDESDLAYLRERNMSLPVVTLGEDRVRFLKQWEGRKVFLDGSSKSIVFLQL